MKITQKEKLRILKLHESYRNWNGSLIKEEDKETTDPADDEEVDDVDSFYSLNAGTEEEEDERREREIDKLGGRFEVKRDSMLPPRIDGGRLDSENFHIGYLEPFEGGNILSDKFIKDFPNLSILHLADNREDLTQRTKNFPSPTLSNISLAPSQPNFKVPSGELAHFNILDFISSGSLSEPIELIKKGSFKSLETPSLGEPL